MTSHVGSAADAARCRIELINPLPVIQRHYEDELLDVLAGPGRAVTVVPAASIELGDASRGARLRRGAVVVGGRLRRGRAPAPDLRLVMWPVFGLADAATWLPQRRSTWLVIHDPQPLRRQAAMGGLAMRAGRLASHHGVGVLTHSEPATATLRSQKWKVTQLPHPIRRPETVGADRGALLSVVGQWKPARSLDALQRLAGLSEWRGRRVVVGRGWPEVDGWSVDSRFLSESELTSALDDSACVVLPYDRYFQSGIAVQCLERLRPVVGRGHPFLRDLFGDDWPGLVVDDDWPAAVARVAQVTAAELSERRMAYWQHCRSAWDNFLAQCAPRDTDPLER